VPVVLVTEGNFFLERVFEAMPLVKLSIVKELPAAVPPGGLLVFHRKVPEKLPPGRVLVIDPSGPTDLWEIGDYLQNPVVARQDKDSPLMAHVRLDNVLLPEARKLTPRGKPQVLAVAATGDPLYCAFERPEGKTLVLTVNLDKGDLPLRTAFPIITTNALSWFAGNQGELRESLAAGAVTEIELPSASGGELLLWPPGDKQGRKLPAGVTRTTIGPLDRVGVWAVAARQPTDEAPAALEIACNLASRAESDLRPPEGLTARDEPVTAGFVNPIWFYLLAAAWLLAGLEWFLYQRRWIS
jgi:hypothetical protein